MTEFQNDRKDKNNMPPIFDLGGIKFIFSLLRIKWSLICKNSSPLHPRMHFAKFGSNWHNDSTNSVNIFFAIL